MNIILKRKIIISLFFTGMALALTVCAFVKMNRRYIDAAVVNSKNAAELSNMQNFNKASAITSAQPSLSNETGNDPIFIMKLVGNELRVISAANETSYTVIESADARTLRDSDRLRLIDGVEIYSQEELAEIIEDFSS